MRARLRPNLTYANVMSTIAVFVALSTGGAYARHLVVNGSDVVNDSLSGDDVRGRAGTSSAPAVNGALTTDDIAGQQANAANGTPFVDGTLTQWDIRNGAVAGVDIASNAITGAKVAPNSLTGTDVADTGSLGPAEIDGLGSADITDGQLTGADIDESSLAQVPSAVLGGIGRWASPGGRCDPDTTFLVTCAFTTVDLPAATNVLVIGTVKAQPEPGGSTATGQCALTTHLGTIPGTLSGFTTGRDYATKFVPLIAVASDVGPGPVDLGIKCNEVDVDIEYFDARVVAVALSPG